MAIDITIIIVVIIIIFVTNKMFLNSTYTYSIYIVAAIRKYELGIRFIVTNYDDVCYRSYIPDDIKSDYGKFDSLLHFANLMSVVFGHTFYFYSRT